MVNMAALYVMSLPFFVVSALNNFLLEPCNKYPQERGVELTNTIFNWKIIQQNNILMLKIYMSKFLVACVVFGPYNEC